MIDGIPEYLQGPLQSFLFQQCCRASMFKKMIYLIVAVVICSAIFMGWKLTSRSAYESAEYTVLETDGQIELRSYPDLMLVTTTMGTRYQGDDGSFGRLFQYISGGNENKQKVAMTTPVFMEPQSASEQSGRTKGQMGFVIPKDVAQTSIPSPTGDQVEVAQRAGGTFAVIRFAGRIDLEVCRQQQTVLESWIEKRELKSDGESEIAGYDPPWTPGPLRRNEILIRIATE